VGTLYGAAARTAVSLRSLPRNRGRNRTGTRDVNRTGTGQEQVLQAQTDFLYSLALATPIPREQSRRRTREISPGAALSGVRLPGAPLFVPAVKGGWLCGSRRAPGSRQTSASTPQRNKPPRGAGSRGDPAHSPPQPGYGTVHDTLLATPFDRAQGLAGGCYSMLTGCICPPASLSSGPLSTNCSSETPDH
jgi:hypothetical protein